MTNFLKLTVIVGFLCFTAQTKAIPNEVKVNPLMACLGKEELSLHRLKETGPIYYLNQHFIKELSTLYGLTLKPKFLNEVCQNKEYSPSVKLLEELLLKGQKAFLIPKSTQRSGVKTIATSSLGSFLNTLPSVFYSYLGRLQALTPKAGCLEKEVPEIAYFMERSKYLEDVIGANTLLERPKKITSIFKKLKNFKKIRKNCQ